MKSKIGIIVVSLLLLGVVFGASVLYNYLSKNVETDQLNVAEDSQEESEKMENSDELNDGSSKDAAKAPDFTVYDYEGNYYKLSDFEGKPVIVNFWASWCSPCKREMPDFEEAFKKYGEDIHFLMINLTDGYQETVESAKEFVENTEYTFPVYYDSDQNAARTYGIYSIPTTLFIDEGGHIKAHAQGAIDAKTLEEGIGYIYSVEAK